jgi:hypothetical protein
VCAAHELRVVGSRQSHSYSTAVLADVADLEWSCLVGVSMTRARAGASAAVRGRL